MPDACARRSLGGVKHDLQLGRPADRDHDLGDGHGCLQASRHGARGGPVLPAVALNYTLQGCELGDLEACYAAGKALIGGGGVSRDAARGRQLIEDACAGGLEAACD